jgi:RNA polymerase sigma factor (sigma-70 family)
VVRHSTERRGSGELLVTYAVRRTDPGEWGVIDDLYPQLRRFAAVAAPADMEPDDLLQEALVQLLRRHALSELDHPGAYLKRTMVNLAASHCRSMGSRRRALQRAAASGDLQAAAEYPSDLAELSVLPPQERAALYLAEVEGYRFQEIGLMLGCSEAAARKCASRARAHLRLTLASEERP